ncbi:hypothetical protein M8J77_013862 [Diaphorina citri]|nr:hypothetical protein M8J77_013862 [Diaphorina citri]
MALSAMTSEDHCSMECMSVQDPHIRAGVPPAGTWLCCMFCGWLRSNKSVHQASISVAMLLVMALLVGSPVIFLITSAPEDRSGCLQQQSEQVIEDVDEGCGIGSSSYETCNTLSCETTSQKVLLDMNPTIEPCRDFYQYACDHFSVAEVQNEYYEPAQLSLTTLHKFIDAQLQDSNFFLSELRGIRAQRSTRDSYGDVAIGNVEVGRIQSHCIVRGEVTPEHKVKLKLAAYKVAITLNEVQDVIEVLWM